ncbi:halocyanin domain-containing protein [Natronosalvus caseinilyticus]|uniref:halocyanin domain-containing protein n=1 Tax=Natronosalvus caseinilyticus TaxID=2953747 RepID=UPI0028AC5607|nr:halocyanin domain-containing protein [Natronosalvus caseinilyticus]
MNNETNSGSRSSHDIEGQRNRSAIDESGPSVSHEGTNRRQFLLTAGTLLVSGALAGCTETLGNGSGEDGGNESVDEWLANADNYDGSIEEPDGDMVTVEVGPDVNEMVFEPAAIQIRPGTTVRWEWIGNGSHNVVATDGLFDSGGVEQRATFEHTFDTVGTTRYYCDPHRRAGMKGVVIVDEHEGAAATENERSG